MTIPGKTAEPERGKFSSPSALWQFAMDTVVLLREAGWSEAADTMESAARYVTSSGWEWLGELHAATKRIEERCNLPEDLRSRLARIRRTAASRHPYE